MKQLLFGLGILALVASCKSETSDSESTDTTPKEETVEDTLEKNNITIFQSNDLGTAEFLKIVDREDGKREWYYWSEKKEEEVRLGVKTVDGLEAIYFFSKPSEIYEIGGSECGFSLFQGEERLQWYDQIEPKCSMNDFH